MSFHNHLFLAYKRDVSLRNMLVHSTDHTSIEHRGSRACQRPRCNTCCHISSVAEILDPNSAFTIRDNFTCQSESLVYCISCRRCPLLYIGETGRNLRSRFSEHLRSIRNNTPGCPVAQHFNYFWFLRCVVWDYAVVLTFNESNVRCG